MTSTTSRWNPAGRSGSTHRSTRRTGLGLLKTRPLLPTSRKGKPTSCLAIGTFLTFGRITMMLTCGERKGGRMMSWISPGKTEAGISQVESLLS